LSPEDRVKMTLDLQNQVLAKIKQLEDMENEINNLTDGTLEIDDLKNEVKSVKKDVKDFNQVPTP
jgi:uncharacterized coiled-coil DUF342 family protein